MSIELAKQLYKLLEDCHRTAELVGLGADVEAAKVALKGVETSEDLYQIYRTDVSPGSMSILNLIAALDERLENLYAASAFCRDRIRMTRTSAHVSSLHKMMADKKKGSIDIKLYQPACTSSDFDKALKEFQNAMGDNVKPKIENAIKKGKGVRCMKLKGICKPVITNSKKNYSPNQIDTAKALVHVIHNM